MRTPDNRKGAVFSIRLTDVDRVLLGRLAALDELRLWGRPRPLGPLVRAAAIAVARRLLCMPMPKDQPFGYWQQLEDRIELDLGKSLAARPPKATPSPARGTTRRRRPPSSRRGTTPRSRGAR